LRWSRYQWCRSNDFGTVPKTLWSLILKRQFQTRFDRRNFKSWRRIKNIFHGPKMIRMNYQTKSQKDNMIISKLNSSIFLNYLFVFFITNRFLHTYPKTHFSN
jgi:hypothetical protein